MKRKLTIAVAGILAIGALAVASPMKFKDCQRKNIMHYAALFEKLNLSDSQKKEIADIRKANFEQRATMMGNNRIRFSAYLTEKGFDKTRFIKDKLAKEEMQTTKMANNFEKMFNILTPSQKREFVTLQKSREQHIQQMMKNRGFNKQCPNMPVM